MNLEEYRNDIESAIDTDYGVKSDLLGNTINTILDDEEGFQMDSTTTSRINVWYEEFEGATWRDLIDWIWSLLKDLWDAYFG